MAQQALVDAVRSAAGSIESRLSSTITLTAIIPADTDPSEDGAHVAVLIAAPWVNWESVPRVLLEFGKDLKRAVDADLSLISAGVTVERVIALPSDDPFVLGVQKLYATRWDGESKEFTESTIADRRVQGGYLITLNTAGPQVEASGAANAPEVLPFDYVDRLDQKVRDARISGARRADFLANFVKDREKSSTIREVIRSQNGLVRSDEPGAFPAGCIFVLLEKGPFVDGVNWAPYQTWEIAIGFERRLGTMLASQLDELPASGSVVWNDWDSMERALTQALGQSDGDQLLIVFDGHPGIDAAVEITKQTPQRWWTSSLRLPGALGEFRGTTVVRLITDRARAGRAYVVDVRRSLQMSQAPADASGALYRFELNEIDHARAGELAADAKVWQKLPDVSHRVRIERHLQQVELRLCEYTNVHLLRDARVVAFDVAVEGERSIPR